MAYADSFVCVIYGDWATGHKYVWTSKKRSSMTKAEKEAYARHVREARHAREAEQARVHAAAASRAKGLYGDKTNTPHGKHYYLKTKGVTPVSGLKMRGGRLIVPIYDENGALVSLQFVDDDGNKRFLTGGRKRGCFFPIGGKDAEKPLLICEGLATGLSLYECLGLPVLVGFDAGNLLPVAEMARSKYPDREIILAADNDTETDGNPGVTKATAAALAVGGSFAVPRHEGRAVDWNDIHKLLGAEAVKEQFMPTLPTLPIGETGETGETEQTESRILPPPPPVPLEAFPPSVAAMLEEAAEAFTVPLQIPATCLLGVLSCLVGGTRLISLRPSWKEPGNIWIATVAASGIGKTPCATAFFAPVKCLEYEAFRQWQDEYASYENEMELVRKERAKAKRGDPMPDRPIQPQRRQAYIDDATVEALGEVLSENPRGIMWRKDELAGLIADLDKYSSGNSGGGTRSRLLSSYDGQEWKTSRTSNPTRNLYIPHAYVGIFGGIQPAMLPKVFEAGSAGVDEASGFLQRFMLIRAEREKPGYWTERYLSQDSKALLSSVAAALWIWDIEYDAEGREVEKVVPVSRQAKDAFIEWFNGIAQEEFLSQNAALLSKLKGQAQRLCLLLHCLDAALAGTDGMGIVTEDCMRRALMLADWAKEHQEQCWRFFSPEKEAKQADPIERAIMAVVVENAARIEAEGWKISNAELFALVEKKLNMPGLSDRKIGKAASGLGLPVCWVTPKTKGRTITQEIILSFKTNVGNVGNVGCHSGARVLSGEANVGQTLVNVGSVLPAWGTTNVTNVAPTSNVGSENVEAVGKPTLPTLPTFDPVYSFDFNDPNYPDDVDRVII